MVDAKNGHAVFPPVRRADLILAPFGDGGDCVVKDPRTGDYFRLGREEAFLLAHLDGRHSAEAIVAEFQATLQAPLTAEEFVEFLEIVRQKGLLQHDSTAAPVPLADPAVAAPAASRTAPDPSRAEEPVAPPRRAGQSLLYWRKSFFDPRVLFAWLEPRIRFFWTPGFLVVSAVSIVFSLALLALNRDALASSFAHSLRWETVVLVWGTMLFVTILHEFAHGLTCKHFGGEVREVGFLMMMFMPSFFCNVSDAWLFREKSKRLWVTLAGGYFELFLWSLTVQLWRLTIQDSLLNYIMFVSLSVTGVKVLFNCNPLLKLDGYYLLSDWMEIPNLQRRAADFLKAEIRWLLWGAEPPAGEPHAAFLRTYGLASLAFSLTFVSFMVVSVGLFLGSTWGWVGLILTVALGFVASRALLAGLVDGEVEQMLSHRKSRAKAWGMVVCGLAAGLCLITIDDRATGSFKVHPSTRSEIRATVSGFLAAALVDEGHRVNAGQLILRMEIPDLESRFAQKKAEIREARVRLRLLEIGTRPEELAVQRRRVERAEAWWKLSQSDLKRTSQSLAEEIQRLEKQVAQAQADVDASADAHKRARALLEKSIITQEDYREADRKYRVHHAQLAQAQAQKRAREATGALEAEAELARRDKELAEARASLILMEAGSRPEEIEAERAHLARLEEEQKYLERLTREVLVRTPVSGLITTPRLREKTRQYFHEGDLICTVEELGLLEAEISLAEQDVARVKPAQVVNLKARALPFDVFSSEVCRVAPSATHAESQSTVTVYCLVQDPAGELRPEMTGHARIYTGRRPIAAILTDRALRFLRTEFWTW